MAIYLKLLNTDVLLLNMKKINVLYRNLIGLDHMFYFQFNQQVLIDMVDIHSII